MKKEREKEREKEELLRSICIDAIGMSLELFEGLQALGLFRRMPADRAEHLSCLTGKSRDFWLMKA